jgi:hypothetical protein
MEISMALFFRNRMASNRRKDAVFELMAKARAILRPDDDTVVSVSEHDCRDSGCCGARTVVLVMRPDQPTEAVKIEKPIESVTQADLSDALAPLAGRHAPAVTHRPPETPTRFDW